MLVLVSVAVGVVAVDHVTYCNTLIISVVVVAAGVVAVVEVVPAGDVFARLTIARGFLRFDRYGHAALSPEQQSTLTECINNLNRCEHT